MPHLAATHPAKLVVADDEEGLLFLMVDALRREGYDVAGFENGGAALDWLSRESADLLLLDLKLGDVPAPDLVERLRNQGRYFPFIIVTGHGDERTVVEVMKQGALDYVMKDAGMLELLPSVVRRALAVVEREKKLAEANAAIRQSEERHQRIIQTALDGFIRFQKSGRILEVNETMCKLLGYSSDDLTKQNVFDMQAAAFRKEVEERVSRLKSEGAVRCFTSMSRKDGTLAEVELSLRAAGGEVFGFVHDISEQRLLEREVLKSVLEERSRFGRELHDGLGQQLTALEMMTHGLVRGLKSVAPDKAKAAEEISLFIRRAVTQTRQLAHGLAPVGVEADGLMVALNELARMTTSAGVQCEFDCPEPVRVPDSAVASHLYRIAQEAVTNALKHAKSSRIQIRLQGREDTLRLSICDNGRGFPRKKPAKAGMGLELIQHRARLIGGQLTIDSQVGKGVRIHCSLTRQ